MNCMRLAVKSEWNLRSIYDYVWVQLITVDVISLVFGNPESENHTQADKTRIVFICCCRFDGVIIWNVIQISNLLAISHCVRSDIAIWEYSIIDQ